MGRTYGHAPKTLKSAKLNNKMHQAIGKLVRAMAEIEDMVDLFIFTLAELDESKGLVLLGKTAITRRIEMAQALAALRPDGAMSVHKAVFNETYYDLLDSRNAVAHGTLLGKDDEGRLFFQTATTTKPWEPGQSIPRMVLSYLPEHIIQHADVAQSLVPQIEQLLHVEEPRAERLRKPLHPHPKARIPRSAKPQLPPQSSQTR